MNEKKTCASEMRTLIKKRELLFALMGEYGGTATLDHVRHVSGENREIKVNPTTKKCE